MKRYKPLFENKKLPKFVSKRGKVTKDGDNFIINYDGYKLWLDQYMEILGDKVKVNEEKKEKWELLKKIENESDMDFLEWFYKAKCYLANVSYITKRGLGKQIPNIRGEKNQTKIKKFIERTEELMGREWYADLEYYPERDDKNNKIFPNDRDELLLTWENYVGNVFDTFEENSPKGIKYVDDFPFSIFI